MRSIVSFAIVGVLAAANPLHAETAKEPATANKHSILMIVPAGEFADEKLFVPKAMFEKKGMKVTIASTVTSTVTGAAKGEVKPELLLEEVDVHAYDAVVFVGGAKLNDRDEAAHKIAQNARSIGKVVSAMNRTPSLLAKANILIDKNATCLDSGILTQRRAKYLQDDLVVDGNIITAKGPEAASKLAEAIIKTLLEKASQEREAAKRFKDLLNEPWQEAFNDPCTGKWQDKWVLDGMRATLTNGPDGMTFTSAKSGHAPAQLHSVLWTKQSFKGDVKIEYEYTRTDKQINYVNILYIQATGDGEEKPKDIHTWRRNIPGMSIYYRFMNLYHISYAAFGYRNSDPNADYIRARRYLPAHDLQGTEMKNEYYRTGLFKTGVSYQITVIKTGKELFMHIKGDGKEKLCHFTGYDFPPVTEGPIGLRHMLSRGARYRDFRVSVPKQPKDK